MTPPSHHALELLRTKHILIIGRFDTPTYHVSKFLLQHAHSVDMIKTSIQIDKALPFIQVSVGNTRIFRERYRIREPFSQYVANAFLRRTQFIINYISICGFFVYYAVGHRTYDVVIGVGPLNGALASVYRLINKSVKTVYYAEDKIERNTNDLFGLVTYLSDLIARYMNHAIWVMSEIYIKEASKALMRKYSYVPIPIVPFSGKMDERKKKRRIVFLGSIAKEHGYDMLYKVFKRLIKIMPDLRLVIIGSGALARRFQDQYTREGIADFIEYKGYIADNDAILKIVSGSSVGVCLYNPRVYKNLAYGQSSKITNYISCGLPVILTGSKGNMPSLATYIQKYNAGYVLRYNQTDIYNGLKDILTSKKTYRTMIKNVAKIPRFFDKRTHYMCAFDRLFSSTTI